MVGLDVDQPADTNPLRTLLHDLAHHAFTGGLALLQAATGQLPESGDRRPVGALRAQHPTLRSDDGVGGYALMRHRLLVLGDRQAGIQPPRLDPGWTRVVRSRPDLGSQHDALIVQMSAQRMGHQETMPPQHHAGIFTMGQDRIH